MCFNRRRRRLTSLLAYLQVNIEGRPSATMTSLDDRKWSGAHADGGPMWSMVRLMLDVSLLRRITFVVLALSVLLCYLGQSLAVVVYFLKQLYTCCCYADLCVCVCVCVCAKDATVQVVYRICCFRRNTDILGSVISQSHLLFTWPPEKFCTVIE